MTWSKLGIASVNAVLLLSIVVSTLHWLNGVSRVVYSFNVGVISVVVGWLGETWVR